MRQYIRYTCGVVSGMLCRMNIVFLGVGVGLLSLVAPGPVNLTLVQFGACKGRQPALRGAVGVIGGDSLLGFTSVLILGVGAALPARVFSATQLAAAGLLVGLGALLAARPSAVSTSVERMHRPTRAFFLLTSLTPTALGGWIAMLAAMPFANDVAQLGLFTCGVLIASGVWHPLLGLAASALGARLTEYGQVRLAQISGLAMAALGLALLANQML
ncbi:MAG: threonine/homoserine/homoserine lactone efflux protein [Paracrocinitomix sp.]|jgi:threonine/homoserine/homoserine lactone efflux protein